MKTSSANIDKEYNEWIAELSKRYRQCQIKASVSVNSYMLRFYWSVGQDISERHMDNKYGSHFYKNLSHDLRSSLNLQKGFSETTLKYTKYFYELYSPLLSNRLHDVDDLEMIFSIPWSHHEYIINKSNGNSDKAFFFVRKTLENNWGRGTLLNFLDTDIYESQGKAQTNFSKVLPTPQGDLAQQILKSPYNFDFLQLGEKYTEKSIKEELVKNIIKFLLELGRGFSFVGKEYHLSAGGKDKYIDLLFYIIPLHCYCVIEVKITEFDFPDIGQLAGYVAMVDDILNTPSDNPAIGLLICKEKNNVLAKYALSKINSPIGISEYTTVGQPLPKELQETLPSPEEIADGLSKF